MSPLLNFVSLNLGVMLKDLLPPEEFLLQSRSSAVFAVGAQELAASEAEMLAGSRNGSPALCLIGKFEKKKTLKGLLCCFSSQKCKQ